MSALFGGRWISRRRLIAGTHNRKRIARLTRGNPEMRSSASRSAVLAVGLVAAVGCVFLAARLFGLTSNGSDTFERRAALCEGLSLSGSQFLAANDESGLREALEQAIALHGDLRAAAVVSSEGETLWTSAPDDDASGLDTVEAPLFADGDSQGLLRLHFARQETDWFMTIALPLFVAAMCFVIFTVVLRSILQRLSGSDEPNESVQRAIDNMADGMVLLDDRERIVLANKAFCDLTGHTMASLRGSKIWALPWRSENELPWKKTLRDGEAGRSESVRLIPQRREPRKLSVNCVPLPGSRGKARGAMISLHDVTDSEKQIRDLKLARTAMQDSSMRSAVLSRVGYRLSGPAGSVLSCAQGLRRGLAIETESQQTHFKAIQQSGRNLVGLLHDITDLQRLESGKLTISRRSCSPHNILAEVYRAFLPRAEQKGVALKFESEGSIPMAINTDPDRFERVLAHLVDNAIKFSNGGEVQVSAKVEKKSNGHQLRIQVRDQGAGIPDELLQEVFTPFVDLGGGRRGGLGLPVCKRSVEALGGQLQVASKSGEGSLFTFHIDTGPLKSVSSRPLRNHDLRPRRVEEDRSVTVRFQGRVLVADNDYHVREALALSLEPLGLEVTLAGNGRDALRSARHLDFSLVMLDTQLAALDGMAAARLLRRHGFTNPIVAITDNPAEQEACRQAGFTRMLLKPIQLDHLLHCLGRTVTAIDAPPEFVDANGAPVSLTDGLNDPDAATPDTQTVNIGVPDDEIAADDTVAPSAMRATNSVSESSAAPTATPATASSDAEQAVQRLTAAHDLLAMAELSQSDAEVEKTLVSSGLKMASHDEFDLEQPHKTDYLASHDSDTQLPEAAAPPRVPLPAIRFLEDFESRRVRLAELGRQGDMRSVQEEANQLHAAARESGFEAMSDAAEQLIQLARDNDAAQMPIVLERLDALAECILSPPNPPLADE